MKVPLTIRDHLRRAAVAYPDRIGVIDEPDQPATSLGSITYRRMAELATAQAARLDALGVGFGERVAVVSHNSARLLVSLFGIPVHGRVVVPINFRLNSDEVGYIVEHCGASVVMVDPELDEALAGVSAPHRFVLGADDAELFLEGVEPEPWEPDEEAVGAINYTSGTTARPKGVQLSHRTLWLNSTVFGWSSGVSDRDVYLHTLPMFHCNGWGMPFTTTAMGVPQVVLRKVDGAEILRRVDRHGVTLMCGAPAVVAAILEAASSWTARSPGPAEPGSWWPARRLRPAPSSGSRPSSAGSSSRSTASPRQLRCSPSTAPRRSGTRSRRRTGRSGWAGPGCPLSGSKSPSTMPARCSPGPTTCSTATGTSRGHRRSHHRRLVPHR